MKIHWLIFSVFFFLVSLTGCSSKKAIDLPDAGVPVDELNQDLVIETDPMFNTFKIGQAVSLSVHLNSQIEVRTTDNFNARLFVLSSETSEWQEIEEVPDLGVFEPVDIVMSKKAGSFDDVSFSVFPSIQNIGGSVQLLVLITGDVYADGQKTDKKVGAYTIVNLKP
jgi:hypothetical protein